MNYIDTKGKKLIYVTACGRSGTTILGYLLGNARHVLDLGEINEWLRFVGRPNGFGPDTENYQFWDRVMSRYVELGGRLDFDRLRQLQRRVDYHYAMLAQLATGYRFRSKECAEFRVFLTMLYQAIFEIGDAHVFVDSSKYPSRLWHLSRILPKEDLMVVHLRRRPDAVIRAMQTGDQGKARSKITATAYYYGVEFLIRQVVKTIPPDNLVNLEYEQMMRQPEACLQEIGHKFGIDEGEVVGKIARQMPLNRGFVFNGNRMRMQKSVVFRKAPVEGAG